MEACGKKRIKRKVDQELENEVKEAKKRKAGYVLVKGEGAGKLVLKTEEKVAVYGPKTKALDHMKQGGISILKLEIGDYTESDYKTAELYKVSYARGEPTFWFVERI